MSIRLDKPSLGEFAADTGPFTTVAVTTNVTASPGSTIIVTGTHLAENSTPQTVTGVADNGPGLTWTIDKQGLDSGLTKAAVWIVSAYAPAGLPSGTTITATFNTTVAGGRSIAATSFLGIATSSPVDTTTGVDQFLTAAWTTASTAILAGSLFIAIATDFFDQQTSTITAPSIEVHDIGNGGFSATTGYRIERLAGSYTIAGTWSALGQGAVGGVAYKAAATVYAFDSFSKTAHRQLPKKLMMGRP